MQDLTLLQKTLEREYGDFICTKRLSWSWASPAPLEGIEDKKYWTDFDTFSKELKKQHNLDDDEDTHNIE